MYHYMIKGGDSILSFGAGGTAALNAQIDGIAANSIFLLSFLSVELNLIIGNYILLSSALLILERLVWGRRWFFQRKPDFENVNMSGRLNTHTLSI